MITVVLARSLYARNIGACARAMANMGVDRLVLIAPQTAIDHEAHQAAAQAQEVLEKAVHYASWSEFYSREGEGERIALTRRQGKLRPSLELSPVVRLLDVTRPIYLFFGREDDGLDSEELSLMHHLCYLPTFSETASLNLAQAVLLTLYIVRENISPRPTSSNNIRSQAFEFPDQLLADWLQAVGFDLSSKRVNAHSTLKRILMQNKSSGHELRLLEAVLRQNLRKLQSGDK